MLRDTEWTQNWHRIVLQNVDRMVTEWWQNCSRIVCLFSLLCGSSWHTILSWFCKLHWQNLMTFFELQFCHHSVYILSYNSVSILCLTTQMYLSLKQAAKCALIGLTMGLKNCMYICGIKHLRQTQPKENYWWLFFLKVTGSNLSTRCMTAQF